MLTLGLLAQHPDHRQSVLGEIYETSVDPQDVRVIGFSGRESDAPHGVWGALAEQLGLRDFFKDCYSPLQAPGQSAWINLFPGPPTRILLDELPPYFENARSKAIANSDLARATTTALSNLLVAINKPELSNVCIIIADLKATYQGGWKSINSALRDLQNETHRGAMQLTPVVLNSDDIFHILRKRLFETLPDNPKITNSIAALLCPEPSRTLGRWISPPQIPTTTAVKFPVPIRSTFPYATFMPTSAKTPATSKPARSSA